VKNPWFNDLITSLCFIDSTKLFIGGLRGFGFLDLTGFYHRDTVVIRYFNAENGFTGNECQQNAVCLDSRGFLWVATTDNLMRIDQSNLPQAVAGPDAYIERISLIDESMKIVPLLKSSVSSGNYHLNYPGRNLRFDFCAPVFRNPSLVRYRYRLEGYDLHWSLPTTERYAVYTNLAPGKYTFYVIACNDAGIWSPKPACFSVVIHPAFWQTWWFRILVPILFAMVFFFFGFLVRNKRRKQEQEKLETEKRMAELQLISIRNQIDPHFTFNAINAIASVIMKEEKEKAYSFFVKLSSLIRQVLTSGDKITRTLADELLFVKNYLDIEKLRFRDSFDFEINIGDGVNLEQEVPKMVVQTYAENSLKHGLLNKKEGMGNLLINVHEESGNLHITVEDNGIGREAARAIGSKSTGKGMKILNQYYDFFDRYNKQKIHQEVTDLYDERHQPIGTRIKVIIPSGFNFQSPTHATH
jgi:two-component sensor histidine kinase